MRNRNGKKLSFIGLAAGLVVLGAAQASAGGYGVREQSSEYQGSSYAGGATAGHGLSSMFWNPATVTAHGGMKSEYNAALILPKSRAKGQTIAAGIVPPGYSADSGNIGKTAVVPSSYSSLQVNDMLWLGLGVSSRFGMRTENRATAISAIYGYKSRITTININPMLGVRLNDQLSLGVGLQVGYMKGDLSTAAAGVLTSRVKGDDWGVGFTAGLLFTPVDGTQIGIGYRSRIKHKLDGKFHYRGVGTNPATVKTTLPDIVTLSVRQRINEQFTLLGSIEWTNWSVLKNFDVESSPVNPAPTAYNWKDGWLFAIGGEYAVNDMLTLRAGYAYEKSPVPDATRNVRVPDNDRHWVSVGLTYRANDLLQLHAAYSHLFAKDGKVNIAATAGPPAMPGLVARYKQHVDIISAGITLDTGKLLSGL